MSSLTVAASAADAAETQSPLFPDPTLPATSGKHVPALDGVRGLAVLGVLLFHAATHLPWTTPVGRVLQQLIGAGWIGVDAFFVLSGFLITGILLDTRDRPNYFRNFYARRVLRIFPLYYAVLALIFIVLPLSTDLFQSEALQTIQRRQGWLWTHMTNLGFVYYRKPFVAAEWLDLTHFWSLAVEEQFYLVWPLFVLLAGSRRLPWICLLLIAGSFGLRIALWLADQRNGALYFPTPCRLDGLAIGGLLATLIRRPGGAAVLFRPALALGAVAVVALATLIVLRGGLNFTDRPTVAFGVACVNVIVAVVLLCIAGPVALVPPLASVFALLPLRFFGKYSYSIYLSHAIMLPTLEHYLPASTFLRWSGGHELLANAMGLSMVVGASVLVALVTWHLIEKQFLKFKVRFHSADGVPIRAADVRAANFR